MRHPARFPLPVLEAIARHVPHGACVLDPFAGMGGVHKLMDLVACETFGVEIEPEWAGMHPRTIVGNALALPFADATFDIVATSPCYGNRFADHHNARDGSRRRSYKHDLGRDLHPESSGTLPWGSRYRDFHRRAWEESRRMLGPGGLLLLNVSNHVRAGKEQPVVEWHLEALQGLGFELADRCLIPTPRMRYGAHHRARVEGEWVLCLGATGPG